MLNQPLKILILTIDEYPFFRVDLNVLFGKELSSMGYSMDWIVQHDSVCVSNRVKHWDGGRAFIAKNPKGNDVLSKIKRHLFRFKNDLKVFTLPRKNQYDIIQVKDKFLAAILSIASCRFYSIPFAFWLSYPFPEAWIYEGRKALVRFPSLRALRGYLSQLLLYKVILPNAKHVFAQSEQMKLDLSRHGVSTKNMTIVPMGIDQANINCRQFKSNEKMNSFDVTFLGIFYKVRKLEFLIRMFKYVLVTHPRARLIFIGKGEKEEVDNYLKNEALRLGISEHVIFTGYLPIDNALKIVHESMVCVSSYPPCFILNSTSPTKVIEYMAMGKAVVGNFHPEQKLLIEESGGGLCVPYNEKDFAEAISTLLSNPEQARKMGENGRKYIKKHRTYHTIASNLHRTYQYILNS